ncbi:type II toxin-antitoxin system VapC family toxin [Candidatus Woesearchaeota archaeon]|nr:type II toxin-antitoxin system VapC family toxin [Candidatus Woesearchaeota archaeon]
MATQTYVIDSSIAIKWYTQEADTSSALRLRSFLMNRTITLIAPDLILYELCNALRWNKQFSRNDVFLVLASLWASGLRIVSPRIGLMEDAIRIAFDAHVTLYDASFLALAQQERVKLITSDVKLAKTSSPYVLTLKDCLEELPSENFDNRPKRGYSKFSGT